MVVILGAFQCTRHWGDLASLLVFAMLGWFMKQFGWPRPPLLVGFVLGKMAERYLFISVARYGIGWLLHPGVIIIGILAIASIYTLVRWRPKMEGGMRGDD